jgi:hypothetical protein
MKTGSPLAEQYGRPKPQPNDERKNRDNWREENNSKKRYEEVDQSFHAYDVDKILTQWPRRISGEGA